MYGLIASCENLARMGVPADCWGDEDHTVVSGHWSGTREEMERALGRRLDSYELTLLSLSRAFGPAPELIDDTLVDFLWPSANNQGGWMEWAELAQMLREYAALNS